MKRFTASMVLATLAIPALWAATPVTQGVAADTLSAIELPELNIVALKQAADLGRQAVSATTLDMSRVNLNDITDIKNLSDLVPNFYVPVYGSRITSTIYVRGIGARMDQPSVGLTIDNMPVLNKDAYDLTLDDISEVEMLRGPQSSLYGRNTMAGLINIRTVSPMRYQGLRLMGEAMVNESFRINGGWYHKFRPNIGFAANVSLNSIHGNFKNQYNNADVGNEKSGSVRLKFEWLLVNGLSILNTFSSSLSHQNGYAYEYVKTGEINYNDTCYYKRFLINDVLTVNYDFSTWNLSGVLSVQHINDDMTLDQDFLPASYFNLTQKKQGTDLTAEILGRRTGHHAYKWLGGVFAFYRHLDMQAPVTFKNDGIANLIEHYRNEANPYYPIAWNSREFLLNSDFTLPSFGLAAYHESQFEVNGWKFSGALRLDYERVTLHYKSETHTGYTIYRNPSGNPDLPVADLEPFAKVPLDIEDGGTLHTDFLTLLPKISVMYSFNSGIGNVYASIGKGYKAGGYNTQMFSDVLQQRLMNLMGIGARYDIDEIVKYKPEYSFNYEIGAHLDFSDQYIDDISRLKLDVSLFYIDCRDQQLTMFPEGNTTGRIMTNAGRTRSFGGELAINWNPWSTLVINGSYGYTNARFVRFFDGKENYKGNRLPYAPQNTLFLQGLYTLRGGKLGDNKIVFDINLRGVGDIYWNEANTLRQPFYMLLGASVMFKAPKWEVQLWGRNLTATNYSTFYFMSISNEFLQRGERMNAGVTLRITV